jgi:hypothetical protein
MMTKHTSDSLLLRDLPREAQTSALNRSRAVEGFTSLFAISAALILSVCVSLCEGYTGAGVAHAQSVDIKLDSALSSGFMVGPSGREISITRAPILIDIDAAFVFDGDDEVEWVLGSLIQAEYTPAFAINPQVRLRKSWKELEMFVGAGLPFFFMPYTRFGSELSVGVSFPKSGPIALVGNINLQTYFLGSDLPEDSTVFTMNGAVGVRMRF